MPLEVGKGDVEIPEARRLRLGRGSPPALSSSKGGSSRVLKRFTPRTPSGRPTYNMLAVSRKAVKETQGQRARGQGYGSPLVG